MSLEGRAPVAGVGVLLDFLPSPLGEGGIPPSLVTSLMTTPRNARSAASSAASTRLG